jgi:hypothetical protein
MFKKMMQHPQLIDSMREIFLTALTERDIVDADTLRQEALKKLEDENQDPQEKKVQEYVDILIDLYFANFFNKVEIENYINLARKEDRFNNLNKVVNMESATSIQIKKSLREFCEIPQGDLFISPSEAEGARVALINHFISNQLPFIGIAKKHITIRDIDELVDHTYWNRRRQGKIGGKSAGMFLAYKILVPKLIHSDSEIERYVKMPESYYFNTGIFSDFIDYNKLHQFHSQKYKTREVIEKEYKHIDELFNKSSFPTDILDAFREFLSKVGEHPIILRSSSLLEDNFGYAFSGKYDSVFLANQGGLEKRLDEFIWGLKKVHMSTYAPGPIRYRIDNDLIDFDERMSVLVQKVVGRRFGDYFFPFASGVAFSYASFTWTPRIKKEEGLIRLVFGLGTRAVDRTGQDYPRMIHLSNPLLRPEVEADQISKYSQKIVDVLNLKSGQLNSIPFISLMNEVKHPDLYYAVSINQDGHLSPPMFKGRPINISRACLTFENLITKTNLVSLMNKIFRKLNQAYGQPIDIEFAWDGELFYILQCRPLAVSKDIGEVEVPKNISKKQILFLNNKVVSSGIISDIEYVVYVDPKAYGTLPTYDEKFAIGRAVSLINRGLQDKRYALFGPGRWGSNDINLGVKVGYDDINHTLILGEIAFEEKGYTPDVSYGTHFFNDLVEAQITPMAIFPDQADTIFNEDLLLQAPNQLKSMVADLGALEPVIHVIHIPSFTDGLLLQVYLDNNSQQGIGFLGTQGSSK